MEQRIQKILAQMGIASRRKAEELIIEGRVTVNGKIATIGMKADLAKDHIKVDGRLLVKPEPKIYLVFNKPVGVVTSLSDPEGRPTIKDFLKGIKYRVFPVGRLDYDSEGLLLITNDGDFAHSLLHPSKKIPKTYVVKVKGIIDEDAMERLRRGVRLEDGLTAPAKVKKVRLSESNSWVEVTIYEGRKRQVRRMLEKVGYPVIKLRRIAIGGLKLGNLRPGEMRRLTQEEIKRLMEVL
ncbi:MAG: pseudouridine synthase [Thermodesulfovibrionales bacterium]|jgi:23S rRNA pseudouridine2605 synthase|nr:pseudouridine synthase [Thermodesulfovibrionales bacterium]